MNAVCFPPHRYWRVFVEATKLMVSEGVSFLDIALLITYYPAGGENGFVQFILYTFEKFTCHLFAFIMAMSGFILQKDEHLHRVVIRPERKGAKRESRIIFNLPSIHLGINTSHTGNIAHQCVGY